MRANRTYWAGTRHNTYQEKPDSSKIRTDNHGEASCWHWRQGICPIKNLPPQPTYSWEMAERTQYKSGFGSLACGEGEPLCQLEGSTVIRIWDPQNWQWHHLPHFLCQIQYWISPLNPLRRWNCCEDSFCCSTRPRAQPKNGSTWVGRVCCSEC